jgi:hypothetical protein
MKLAVLSISLALPSMCFGQTAWERYVQLPSPENADAVQEIAYSVDSSAEYSGTSILESQVISGDLSALRLALRLSKRADGGTLHDLFIAISRTIRPRPETFVAELVAADLDTKLWPNLLLSVGEEYVDLPEARSYELSARRQALETVMRSDLSAAKEACVRVLRDDA